MTFNGLPLHPLIVHAAVVAVPATALLTLLFVARPAWQPRLRLPLLALAVVSALLIWLTAATGDSLASAVSAGGRVKQLIENHETWAGRLQAGTWVLAGLTAVTVLFGHRLGWFKGLLHGLLAAAAVAVVVLVAFTGDAGAQAAWYGVH